MHQFVSAADGPNAEKLIARVMAVGLGLIGVAFFAVYPITRVAANRDRADIDRALAPLVSVPLEQLQSPGARIVDITIPNDDQWKRIARRLGAPSFALAAAAASSRTYDRLTPVPDVALSLRVWRNGTEVAVANGSTFTADPGDRLRFSARIGPAALPAGSVFLLLPRWSTSSAADWAEGAGIGSAIIHVLALSSVLPGIVFVWWALTIAWGSRTDA
jgi:hypothetical protein